MRSLTTFAALLASSSGVTSGGIQAEFLRPSVEEVTLANAHIHTYTSSLAAMQWGGSAAASTVHTVKPRPDVSQIKLTFSVVGEDVEFPIDCGAFRLFPENDAFQEGCRLVPAAAAFEPDCAAFSLFPTCTEVEKDGVKQCGCPSNEPSEQPDICDSFRLFPENLCIGATPTEAPIEPATATPSEQPGTGSSPTSAVPIPAEPSSAFPLISGKCGECDSSSPCVLDSGNGNFTCAAAVEYTDEIGILGEAGATFFGCPVNHVCCNEGCNRAQIQCTATSDVFTDELCNTKCAPIDDITEESCPPEDCSCSVTQANSIVPGSASSAGLSAGAIAAIVAAIVGAVALIVAGVFHHKRRGLEDGDFVPDESIDAESAEYAAM